MWNHFTRKQTTLLIVFCAAVFTGLFVFSKYKNYRRINSLISHKGFTTGQLINVKIIGSPPIYVYQYSVKGKPTTTFGSTRHNGNWLVMKTKYMPVIYDTTNPNTYFMLIYPEDFERYGLAFPDSLQWVLKINRWRPIRAQ